MKRRVFGPVLAALMALGVMVGGQALPALATCTAPCAYDTYVTGTANSGLVAYYPMYDTSGTTMTDTSGNGKNGTYSNVTLNGVSGAAFNGTTSIASTPNLDTANANQVMTVAAWVIDRDTSSTAKIMWEQTTNSGSNTGAVAFDINDGAPASYKFTTWENNGTHYYTRHFARPGNTNWHFFVWEFDRNTTEGCFSALVSVDTGDPGSSNDQCWEMHNVAFPNGKPFFFGARSGPANAYQVDLRGVGIWTRGLSATEISAMYGSTFH